MVSRVDGRGDESSRFRICAGNGQEIGTHDIGLGSDSHKTINVFTNRYQNFTCHVTALLSPRRLIFDMDTCCSFLDK